MIRSVLRPTALIVAVLVASLAGCSEDRADDSSPSTTTVDQTDTICDPADLLACARRSSIADAVPATTSAATGEPLVLGMINQENTPLGSFPELSSATKAAIAFVNAELGGVHGRPIELKVCNTKFSPEGSTACGQQFVQDGVPAVLGGIDVFGTAVDTLADNGIPYVGGIPVSNASADDANSYQWSGGIWAATVAFAHHAATERDAKRVAIVYGDFGSIAESADYGKRTLEQADVEAQMIPYPITATDLSSPLQAAAAGNPDAMIVLVADTGCQGAFDGVATIGIPAQMYYVGACADPRITDEAGPAKTEGAIFNVENPIDRSGDDVDFALYQEIATAYGDGFDPVGAGTVSFRSFMNLYRVLVGLDPDQLTPSAIAAALEAEVDAPNYMGHPYTCDHQQLEGLPALCSPQQILAEMRDGDLFQIGDWIDVGEIYAG